MTPAWLARVFPGPGQETSPTVWVYCNSPVFEHLEVRIRRCRGVASNDSRRIVNDGPGKPDLLTLSLAAGIGPGPVYFLRPQRSSSSGIHPLTNLRTSQIIPLRSVPVVKSPYHLHRAAPPPTALWHFLHARVIDPNRSPFRRLVDVKNSSTSLDWKESTFDQPTNVRPLHNILQRLLLTRYDVCQVMSIDMLPDDVLLDIFGFCVEENWLILKKKSTKKSKKQIPAWQRLVHVCRRWRSVVLGSPRRLNLRLFCSDKTPARDNLDVWPALPLSIECNGRAEGIDNIVAVLKRSDRVRQIKLTARIETSDLEQILAAMQVPFPELTDLQLWSHGDMSALSALPDSFLGGSVPRLQSLWFIRIPFPGLPKLLLSATHLVTLQLENIPHLGYFSPESTVTALSTLPSLKTLWLFFQSPQSFSDWARQRPPPLRRSVLPVLTYFQFKGVSEYLEVVVARIDAPRLNKLIINLFNDIVFDMPEFNKFIYRTPTLNALQKARVTFDGDATAVELSSPTSGKYEELGVRIRCRELDWQASSMEQVCTSCLPPLPTLEDLHIYENPHWRQRRQDEIEDAVWLVLLRSFTSVKNLYLSSDIARRIVPALEGLVGDRATEVLPTLRNIFLEGQPSGPVQDGIQQVVAARQAVSRPIAVSYGQRVL